MSVICLTSLKGGVGKTSLSINLAHALAQDGCQVLLIDLDPAAHASRFLRVNASSPLAELFLSEGIEKEPSILDRAINSKMFVVKQARNSFDVVAGGAELRHFYWGQAAISFKNLFQKFISEMENVYDHIVIDTAPDFNILTRNAVAASQVSLVPVDTSEMSIFGLEEILRNTAHIKGPTWGIVRSMVPKQASRIQKLAEKNLDERFDLKNTKDVSLEEDDDEEFFELIEEYQEKSNTTLDSNTEIYLLNAKIFRSEQLNRLSFSGKTAFDTKATLNLAKQYRQVAQEIEFLLEMNEGLETELTLESFSKMGGTLATKQHSQEEETYLATGS